LSLPELSACVEGDALQGKQGNPPEIARRKKPIKISFSSILPEIYVIMSVLNL